MRHVSDLTFQAHEQCEALRAVVVESMMSEGLRAKRRGLRAGDLIWNPAAKPDRVFQLKSGRVRIVASDRRGNEILVRAVKPGEMFGEICFCSHADAPHGTTAIAACSTEILEAGYDDFRRKLNTDSTLMTSVLKLFCSRLAEADQRVQILAERDARQRLRKLLAHMAAFRGTPSKRGGAEMSVTLTHAELASFGGLSRPHLSLLMAEFRDQGLVFYQRGSALRINVGKINELS